MTIPRFDPANLIKIPLCAHCVADVFAARELYTCRTPDSEEPYPMSPNKLPDVVAAGGQVFDPGGIRIRPEAVARFRGTDVCGPHAAMLIHGPKRLAGMHTPKTNSIPPRTAPELKPFPTDQGWPAVHGVLARFDQLAPTLPRRPVEHIDYQEAADVREIRREMAVEAGAEDVEADARDWADQP